MPYSISGGSLIYTAFADAFIEPKRVPNSYTQVPVPFKKNVTGADSALATVAKDLYDTEDFWVVSLVCAWQPDIDFDLDPKEANSASIRGSAKESDNSGFVFIETIRELEGLPQNLRHFEEHVIVHEIGHMGKAPGNPKFEHLPIPDHPDGGIMAKGAPPDQDSFKAVTIKRFRESKTF